MSYDLFGRSRLWAARPVRIRLGQGPYSEITPEMLAPGIPNRLDEIPATVIFERRELLRLADENGNFPSDLDAALEKIKNTPNKDLLSGWNKDDYRLLLEISQNPTEQEMEDLALIDGFVGLGKQPFVSSYLDPQGRLSPIIRDRIRLDYACGKETDYSAQVRQKFNPPPYKRGLFQGNGFFCGEKQQIPIPRSAALYYTSSAIGTNRLAEYYGIDLSLPWQEIKGPVLRVIAVLDALVDYPFPSPIGLRPLYWYEYPSVKAAARQFIHQDIIINRALARLWITMAIIGDKGDVYNTVSAYIIHDIKKEARDRKRDLIIQKIAMAATFAIITLGLGYALAPAVAAIIPAGVPVTGATVASAITSGVQQALSAQEKKDVAEAMETISEQFAQSDPAFAAEAKKAADTFSFLGEQITEMTEEERLAAEEAKADKDELSNVAEDPLAEPDYGESTTNLLIGGGIAAGIAASVAGILLLG